jgi:cytochrome c oxidase subunit III
MNAVTENRRNKIHPLKLALWVGCSSITMMFIGWTSAYIVRKAAGNWLEFSLPTIFYYSTVVLFVSSITLHLSYINFKKSNEGLYKGLLIFTFILALVFVFMQYEGWVQLKNSGVPFTLNPSGDFIYVLSGMHVAHVLGGVVVLTVAMLHAFYLKFKPTENRINRLELTLNYWHFVDFLWIWLIIIFVTQ